MSTSCRLVLFSFNNSETVKAVTLVFSNFLETFQLNLVSLTHFTLQILGKTQTRILDIWISGQSFINENCHNSRASYDIEMKPASVTKLNKSNK